MTTFVSRAEWGARPPTSAIPNITSEVTTGHWEGGGIWGGTIGSHDSCATKVRGIQAYHMDHNGWTDIAYNDVACPHDYVFVGRGPGKRSAANGTNPANSASAVVCYLGGVGDPFTDDGKRAMLAAAQHLGQPLRKCHSDWYQTACCGPVICPWIHAGAPSPDPKPQPPKPQPTPEDDNMRGITFKDQRGRRWVMWINASHTLRGRVDGEPATLTFQGAWIEIIDVILGDGDTMDFYGVGSGDTQEAFKLHNDGTVWSAPIAL